MSGQKVSWQNFLIKIEKKYKIYVEEKITGKTINFNFFWKKESRIGFFLAGNFSGSFSQILMNFPFIFPEKFSIVFDQNFFLDFSKRI